jgi:hypothetical protein
VEEPTQNQIRPEWPPSNRTLKSYEKLETTSEQTKFVQERIFTHKIFKDLYGVQSIIMDSIQKFGLDPKRNFFLDFVVNLGVPMPNAKLKPKLQYIYSSYLNKKMDLKMEVLKNPTLYERSDREFQYTLNAFYLFSDPKRYNNYLKPSEKTRQVSVSQFMDGDVVKPAGLNGQKGDTIFNVIEEWAKDNEYSPEEIANRKNKENNTITIGSILKTGKHRSYRYLSKIVDIYYPEVDVDVEGEQLHFMLYTAFSLLDIENIFNNITPQMLPNVKQGLNSEIKMSDLNPQKDVEPGTLINTPNVKNDPVSLYLYHKLVVLSKNNKFIADDVENTAQSIQDIILDAPIQKPDTKDISEIGKSIVIALSEAFKSNNVESLLNSIWQENIV